jgi:hypothetical protein
MTETIYREALDERMRHVVPAELFGHAFPLRVEPFVFSVASQLSPDYTGGYWEFYTLSNGGFYMAPVSDRHYRVSCPNGYEGTLSPDAFGVACCLYAFSNLSFDGDEALARECATQFHALREYMLGHAEAGVVLRAIDSARRPSRGLPQLPPRRNDPLSGGPRRCADADVAALCAGGAAPRLVRPLSVRSGPYLSRKERQTAPRGNGKLSFLC